ncbi:MAG: flagellar hook-length control protein FliK [Pedococcus sp.]
MSRVEAVPAAPAAMNPGRNGGRSSAAGDGASFEVAIRTQLDAGGSPNVRERVDPADPRSRSTISVRSQRPTPDSVFERPLRAARSERADPTDRPNHPARFQRPNRDTSSTVAVHGPAATSMTTASDAVAPASQPSSETDTVLTSAASAPAVVATSPEAGAAGASPAAATPGVPATGSGATALGVAPATQAQATAATEGRLPGAVAGTDPTAAAVSSTDSSLAPAVTTDRAGAGQAGAQTGGQTGAGQPEAGQSGAGQSEGTTVPTSVHGRPAALSGADTARPGTDADPSTVAVVPGAAVDEAVPTTSPVVAGPPATVVDTTAAAAGVATAPTTGATAATPVATTPVANPVLPLPPQAQVLSAVSPLLTGPDGTHRVTVTLEPENLGKVRVQLTLSGGEVALHLIAADAATRETLRLGLPELRAQLEQSGLRTAGMDVQSGSADLFGQAGAGAGTGGGTAPRAGHGAIPTHRTATHDAVQATPNPTARSLSHDVALDVRM